MEKEIEVMKMKNKELKEENQKLKDIIMNQEEEKEKINHKKKQRLNKMIRRKTIFQELRI